MYRTFQRFYTIADSLIRKILSLTVQIQDSEQQRSKLVSIGNSTESDSCWMPILPYRKFQSASFIYHASDMGGAFGYIFQ